MYKISIIGLIFGLVLLMALLAYQNINTIVALLISFGWSFLILPMIWLPALVFAAEAWRYVFHPTQAPGLYQAITGIWVGSAVNSLIPTASIGGEVAKARLMVLFGKNTHMAIASVIVDKTVQALAVVLWGLIGVGILFVKRSDDQLARFILLGFFILAFFIIIFFLIQKAGIFSLLAKLGSKLIRPYDWSGAKINASAIDTFITMIYQQRGRCSIALLYKVFGFIVQTGEVWFAFFLLGYPLSIIEALMLKSLTATISDVAFLVPNGYGIQEGAFIVIGMLLGVDATLALTISVAIRMRELIINIPGLLYWQHIERRNLYAPKKAS